MKKILYSFFLLTLGLPILVNAATFSFSPNSGSFAPNDLFSVAVFVNPSVGEEITVAKLVAQFPPNVLEVVSFSQSDGWMSPTSGEFDSLDNNTGNFEKMAGFPARITESKQFGTVTFKAKTDGVATITSEGSLILDIANSDKYVISSGATFSIITPIKESIKKKTKVVKKQEPVKKVTFVEKNTSEEDVVATSTLEKTEMDIATSSLATVAEASDNFFTTKNISFLIAFIIAAFLGFFLVKKKEDKFI